MGSMLYVGGTQIFKYHSKQASSYVYGLQFKVWGHNFGTFFERGTILETKFDLWIRHSQKFATLDYLFHENEQNNLLSH